MIAATIAPISIINRSKMITVAAEVVSLMATLVVVAGFDVLVAPSATPSLQITSTTSIAFSGYGKGF